MTNKEKFIEVFGDNPQRHNITKSWWDEEYVPQITIKFDLDDFTDEGETDIESISTPTGIAFYDEPQNCDRAISLNAALEKKILAPIAPVIQGQNVVYRDVVFVDDIMQLPSVTPNRPTGNWIMKHRNINKIEYHTGEDVLTDEIHTVKELIRYETDEPYCSECGKRAEDIAQDFCGYCGVYMRGDDNADSD